MDRPSRYIAQLLDHGVLSDNDAILAYIRHLEEAIKGEDWEVLHEIAAALSTGE